MGIIVGSTEKKGGATLFQAPISVGDPRAFAFGPTAETLAMVLDGQTVLVWNCKSNSIISVYNKHRGPVNSVAFSPDGQEVISASDDATAHIWDPNTGEMTAELRGHTGEVQSASFSPDGNLILTVSTDGTGILWERRHLARIATLEGKQGPISAASFSSNGNRIVTLTSNGYGSLWTSPEGQHLGSFRTSEDLSLCQAAEFTSADKTFLTRTSTGTSLWDSDSLKFLFNSETQDNIHLFPDHSVLSVSTQGVVARRNLEVPIPSSRCTASSYEITTFPSEGGLSIENNSPARDMVTVIPMGTDDFISILKLLTACIERPDNSPGQGLPLDACVRLSPLSHMRFRASDIITHINGVSLGPDGAALRLLYDLNAHTDGAQKNCSLRLTLLRNGVPINFVCQSWPVTTQSETARVEPEAAREFIDTQRQLFLQNESLWSEKGGVTLTGQTVDTWRDSFLIWPYDVLIKLDNTDISLASHGRDPFKELAEGIAGGQVKEFKETLQRGQFLQVSIIYSVS
jgi:WD40 repeat protein